MNALPIDSLIPQILDTLRADRNLVIEAAPGAGKTTRVPAAIEAAGGGEVLVLEPRRIAARMAARRTAEERGEPIGESVGYHVRFEHVAGPRTRLRFLTEGVLVRRLLADPELRGVSTVVLDEFHERHLDGDAALALLLKLQESTRPDLRIVVMSATVAGEAVAHFLGGCPRLVGEGRLFDLAIDYQPESRQPLEDRVASAVETLLKDGEGHILVFLPGAAEIRRSMERYAKALRNDLLLLPLHGDLPPEEQDKAVSPSKRRKVVFSTNVAESSITIDGVRGVVDSGLARVASDSPWNGLPRVEVRRISQASAKQRAGRAGRTAPGRVIRLYSAEDYHRRPEYDAPEILRRELSQLCLDLHAAGITEIGQLKWLDSPPSSSLDAAEELLRRLTALDERGQITELGREMAHYPLHPRLSRLAIEGGRQGCAAAAILSVGTRLAGMPDHAAASDVELLLERPMDSRTRQLVQQIQRTARAPRRTASNDNNLSLTLLRAFPDRVARRRKTDLQLSTGGRAQLSPSSAVTQAEFLIALDVEERPDQGGAIVRMASAIEPEWLLELFPARIQEVTETRWNSELGRGERLATLWYDRLLIEETRTELPIEEAIPLLVQEAARLGIDNLADAVSWARLKDRLAFAAAQATLPPLTSSQVDGALTALAVGCRTIAELKSAMGHGRWEQAILSQFSGNASRMLDDTAPDRIRLPGGRTVRVEYPAGQAPYIASRLQDFFGMNATPRVAGGRVPLVVHLLAPSQRPLQTTTDLGGFWERLYPQLRREYSRRYPKHAWPENPYTAR